MKRSLSAILIENSKYAKHVDGEMGVPSYDSISTPDNHTTGKRDKSVDGNKNLGKRPSDKKVAQVQPPKKVRRPVSEGPEDEMVDDMDELDEPTTARGKGYQESEEVEETMTNGAMTMPDYGSITNKRSKGQKMRPARVSGGIVNKGATATPEKATGGAGKKSLSAKGKKVREGLGDNPDSKASMPFSKAKNKDEGMKTPKVATMKGGVARKSRVGSKTGDHIENKANIGKTQKLPKGYMGGENVAVQKVHEGISELVDFLGELNLSEEFMGDIMENYPDDMNWGAFDATMGTDGDDAAAEHAIEEMKDAVQQFLSHDGATYLEDYRNNLNNPKARDDAAWYLEHLSGMTEEAMRVAVGAVSHSGMEVDEKQLKAMLVSFMKKGGVADEHIPAAFEDYMTEDSFQSGGSNALDTAEYILAQNGYRVAGGGMTGGQKMFKNTETGALATVNVHSFRPNEVIGWAVRGQQGKQEGKSVADLRQAVSANKPRAGGRLNKFGKPSIFGRRKQTAEMSSGGAVGAGAIASSAGGNRPKSQLFAGEGDAIDGEVANIPQTVDAYITELDPYMEKHYYMSWQEAAGDASPIERAIKAGMTPQEFADRWADHVGIEKDDGSITGDVM